MADKVILSTYFLIVIDRSFKEVKGCVYMSTLFTSPKKLIKPRDTENVPQTERYGVITEERLDELQDALSLRVLCPTTIYYLNENETDFISKTSTNSEALYEPCCRIYQESIRKNGCNECGKLAVRALYDEIKDIMQNKKDPVSDRFHKYGNKPWQIYFEFICPFMGFLKYAFPLVIEDSLLAIITFGQFMTREIAHEAKKKREIILKHELEIKEFIRGYMNPLNYDKRVYDTIVEEEYNKVKTDILTIQLPEDDNTTEKWKKRELIKTNKKLVCFDTGAQLKTYIFDIIIPEIEVFANKCRRFLKENRRNKLGNERRKTEQYLDITLDQVYKDIPADSLHDYTEIIKNSVKDTALSALSSFCFDAGIESLVLFLNDELLSRDKKYLHLWLDTSNELPTHTTFDGSKFSFPIQHDANDNYHNEYFTRKPDGSPKNEHYFSFINSKLRYFREDSEILIRPFENGLSFAVVFRFRKDISREILLDDGQMRYYICERIMQICDHIKQDVNYSFSVLSQQTTVSILRIYRHEIIHQITLLSKYSDLFHNPKYLLQIIKEKFENLSKDYDSCLKMLDFFTKNVGIFVGSYNSESIEKNKTETKIYKLLYSWQALYGKKAAIENGIDIHVERYFDIKEKISCNENFLELMIYNMGLNAVKYAHLGSSVTLSCSKQDIFPYYPIITVKDYGKKITNDQVLPYKLYYRDDNETEGSGIGLYLTKRVAKMMSVKISHECKFVSEYNVPLLEPYLKLPQDEKRTEISDEAIMSEIIRLKELKLYDSILYKNTKYEPRLPQMKEILADIKRPTYEVIFSIKL
jgi:hypothetical protein